MHSSRPKSAKGRSRGTTDSLTHGKSSDNIGEKPQEFLLGGNQDGRLLRPRSAAEMQPIRRWNREEVPHFQFDAVRPPASLNKYQVLPSIKSRQSEERPGKGLDKRMRQLSLSDEAVALEDSSNVGAWSQRPEKPPPRTKPGSLLLAIRAPCGRRFEQRFDPADTLRAVRSSAEDRFGVTYTEAFIETMDVPRRTFTDMDLTLERCGILHRSVLCISQNCGHIQHQRR